MVQSVLSISVSASVMLLLLLAMRYSFKKAITAKCMYLLLLIVLLRLIVPVSINGVLSKYIPSAEPVQTVMERLETRPTENPSGSQAESPALTEPEITFDKTGVISPNGISFGMTVNVIWAAGMFFSFGIKLITYLHYTGRIKRIMFKNDDYVSVLRQISEKKTVPDVYISPETVTPMAVGLIKPVIILPDRSFSESELYGILKHEYCHICRFDVAIKWLSALVCSVYWFNPFISVLFDRKLEEYCELSCDESVAINMSPAQRDSYIRTLIRTAEWQTEMRRTPVTAMSGSGKRLDNRLKAISSAKKASKVTVILTAVLVPAFICVGLLTGGQVHAQTNVMEARQSNPSDSGFVSIEYGITPKGLVWSEKEDTWVNPLPDGSYNFDTHRTGRTNDKLTVDKLFALVDPNQYAISDAFDDPEKGIMDYLDTDPSNSGVLTVSFFDHENNSRYIAMDKNGNMVVIYFYRSGEKYEKLAKEIYQHTLRKPDEVMGEYHLYSVPNDLYGKVADILFTLPKDPYEEFIPEE